jgi:hypothetical protein
MPRTAKLPRSVRRTKALKEELEKVSRNEGRSISQVCEALLNGGLECYQIPAVVTRKASVGRRLCTYRCECSFVYCPAPTLIINHKKRNGAGTSGCLPTLNKYQPCR